MNILVAGGAGFIGSHLIDKFIGQGHNIICADRLIMGSHCIKHLSDEKLFQFYNINLADQEVTNQLFQKNRIDAVYHLAAERFGASVEDCVVVEDALFALKTAKKAGFLTIGVYEKSEPDQEEIRYFSDRYVKHYDELMGILD